MTAKIIAVVNQKGGCGKTTLSMQLAGSLARRHHKILVIDADPQGTATRWAASAEDETPFPASVVGLSAANSKVHREVKKFVEDYEFIIIDCPPAIDSPVPQSALLIADLALVPLIPSPPDMWASVGIRQLISDMKVVNETLVARIIFNQFQANTTLAKEVVELIPQFDMQACEAVIKQRQVYRQSAVYGKTVFDLKAPDAMAEIEQFTDEVLSLLREEPSPEESS